MARRLEEPGDEVVGEAVEDGRMLQGNVNEVLAVVADEAVGRVRAEQVVEVVMLQPVRAGRDDESR